MKKIKLLYKKIRGILKRNNLIFSFHRHLTDKDYQRERKRMLSCATKSQEQIKKEMTEYARYWGCPADDYVRYGLFDKNISMEEILDYVPMQFYYCQFHDEMFSGVDAKKADDKLVEYFMFKEKGIPQPDVIGVIRNRKLFSVEQNPISFNDMITLVQEGERLFIKPTDGDCGNGIIVVCKKGGRILLKGKDIQSLDDMPLSTTSTYIVQKGLVQRSDFAAINESSLNTLRTIVKYESGDAKIVAMLLRVGRKGSDVDNSGQGGISIEVNLSDGSLGEYAGREHGGCLFPKHPDTGFVFKNFKFANWDSVMKQTQNIISRITDYKTIGWDIAVCEDKVYAIEMNMGWGIEHAQTIAGGFRRKMGIYPKKDEQ